MFWCGIYNVAAQRQKLTLNLHRFWGGNGWGEAMVGGIKCTVGGNYSQAGSSGFEGE